MHLQSVTSVLFALTWLFAQVKDCADIVVLTSPSPMMVPANTRKWYGCVSRRPVTVAMRSTKLHTAECMLRLHVTVPTTASKLAASAASTR